jgi:hypothetical protein
VYVGRKQQKAEKPQDNQKIRAIILKRACKRITSREKLAGETSNRRAIINRGQAERLQA